MLPTMQDFGKILERLGMESLEQRMRGGLTKVYKIMRVTGMVDLFSLSDGKNIKKEGISLNCVIKVALRGVKHREVDFCNTLPEVVEESDTITV